MATTTTPNLSLQKQASTDFVDETIELNPNYDIVDGLWRSTTAFQRAFIDRNSNPWEIPWWNDSSAASYVPPEWPAYFNIKAGKNYALKMLLHTTGQPGSRFRCLPYGLGPTSRMMMTNFNLTKTNLPSLVPLMGVGSSNLNHSTFLNAGQGDVKLVNYAYPVVTNAQRVNGQTFPNPVGWGMQTSNCSFGTYWLYTANGGQITLNKQNASQSGWFALVSPFIPINAEETNIAVGSRWSATAKAGLTTPGSGSNFLQLSITFCDSNFNILRTDYNNPSGSLVTTPTTFNAPAFDNVAGVPANTAYVYFSYFWAFPADPSLTTLFVTADNLGMYNQSTLPNPNWFTYETASTGLVDYYRSDNDNNRSVQVQFGQNYWAIANSSSVNSTMVRGVLQINSGVDMQLANPIRFVREHANTKSYLNRAFVVLEEI